MDTNSVFKIMFIISFGLITSLLSIQSLSAATDTSSTSPSSALDMGKSHFAMQFPNNWKIYQNKDGFDVLGIGPKGIMVGIKEGPADVNVDQFFDAGLKIIPNTVEHFSIQEKGKATLDGVDSRYVIYSGKIGGEESKTLQYFIIKNNRAYIIVMSASPNDFDSVKADMFKLATYFKIAQ